MESRWRIGAVWPGLQHLWEVAGGDSPGFCSRLLFAFPHDFYLTDRPAGAGQVWGAYLLDTGTYTVWQFVRQPKFAPHYPYGNFVVADSTVPDLTNPF